MLTLRKRAFIAHYKAVKNASMAAKLAGYSPKSCGDAGHRLLKDPEIAHILKEWERDEIEKPARIVREITQDIYASKAYENYENQTLKPDLRHKYFELFGKVRGFLNSEVPGAINIYALIGADISSIARRMNTSGFLKSSRRSPTTIPSDKDSIDITHNSIDTNRLDASVNTDKTQDGGGEGITPPRGESVEITNPLPNPATISNLSIGSINTENVVSDSVNETCDAKGSS